MGLPAGCARNNPLNLRPTNPPFDGTTGQSGGFSTFASMDYGIRAAAVNAKTHAGRGESLQQFIYAVGPASDGNNPASYTQFVISGLAAAGIKACPGTPLSSIVATPAGMAALLSRMIQCEVGGKCGLSNVASGVALAFA